VRRHPGSALPNPDKRGDRNIEEKDSAMEQFVALAREQLEKIESLCTRSGLRYVELASEVMGVGIAVGFGQYDYTILSILGGGSENQVMITSGILTDIKKDRLSALEAANHFTSDNTACPVYFHDAEAAWSLLIQQTYPVQLMIDVPQYFNNCVRGLPHTASEYRNTAAAKWDLGGRPWEWTPEDRESLLMRSLM
jgi:hypothetical protein